MEVWGEVLAEADRLIGEFERQQEPGKGVEYALTAVRISKDA